MRTIHPPVHDQNTPTNCATSLEPAFAQLLERAEQAGWGRHQVLHAICVLTWRFAEEAMEPLATQNAEMAA